MKDAGKEQQALQTELFHAHKLDAVGRLAGGVAHDYNNMLGVILGGCELMKMKMPPDSPELEDLNHIYSAATRSVKIDPTSVDQILMNLCINARDALAGPGTIEIRTDSFYLAERSLPDCPGGVYARLNVKDDGPGMDSELKSKAFDPVKLSLIPPEMAR